ncbi:MAG: ribonuclease III [Lachnospiraceae bacterium]|nr:ribonuclease III [Lachnospiraceae bacterium]
MDNRIAEFENAIGYSFINKSLLKCALTHTSYVNENKNEGLEDNERLEFFGDAIIEFHVSEYLFRKYNNFPEGDLTRIRASMVCEQSLAQCAKAISLGSYLYMGKGEEASGGRERASITSDAFEALVAAIYLDSGRENTFRFIQSHLLAVLDNKDLFFDAKTRLQEIVQKRGENAPHYELLSEEGPSHDRTFEVAAFINDREISRGKGHSKKAAQQEAALQAIKILSGENPE